ncbi:MAG: serine hydrolase domain-containing protein [Pseudomonadota bacterium]
MASQKLLTWLLVTLLAVTTGQAFAAAASVDDPADSPPDHAALRARFATLLEENKVPGVSYAVFTADGVQLLDAMGEADATSKQPLTPHTRMRIGSVTKVFTALLILRAVEAGKFRLDTPVKDILPDLPLVNPYEQSAPVRIIHLLEHTAGIDDMQLGSIYRAAETRDSHFRVAQHDAKSLRVRWQPGTQWSYSNSGYTVLAALAEKVYDKDWESLVQEQVLAPLQLNETEVTAADATKHAHASGYRGDEQRPVGVPFFWHRAASSIWSTAGDLAVLGRFLLTEGASRPGVISTQLLRDMRRVHTTQAAQAGLQWGYGLGLYQQQFKGLPMIGHNGVIDGFAANVFFSPELGMGFAEIHNSDNTVVKFGRALSGYLQMQRPQTTIAPTAAVPLGDADAAQVNGWYRMSNTRNHLMRGADYLVGASHLNWRDNALQLEPLTGEPQQFHYVGNDLWRDSQRKRADSVMLRDADGNVTAFEADGIYLERVSAFSVFAPIIAIVLGLLALLTAPFGHRRALANPWPRRWNALALVAFACIIAGLSMIDSLATAATVGRGPMLLFVGTILLPLAAVAGVIAIARAWSQPGSTLAKWRCAAGAAGALTLSIYFACFNWLALGLWWN